MKIAYVANIRFPTEKAHGIQIAKACEALAKAGEEVVLLVPSRHTDIQEPALQYYGIKESFRIQYVASADTASWGKLGFWLQSLLFALSVRVHLRDIEPDVVYGRDELVLSILSLCGVTKIFWESHDGTWNIASRYIAKRMEGVVVVSRGLKALYERLGIAAENICAVPNGIDMAAFSAVETKEIARERLHLPQDKKIALYIGRLDGWKGSETLLEASRFLPEDFSVAIIGGELAQIETLKKKYPGVLFLGYRPYSELANNQAAADVLVVPNTAKDKVSVSYTSPLKLIAHMASHRPIVASDLPSIRELVDDTSAVLVAPDSPQALADGIQKAYGNTEVAEAAFQRAASLDWQARAKTILSFLASK